ncbi:MAG: hypothetical protein HZB68_03100 [Candidatus Aenigmarchaeota archaeon]|nr:hypothetical protein [Candidatus Aenigmarchaeota archaeon]
MNKNLKDLAKEHADYSVEEKSNVGGKKETFLDKAERIYHSINSDIGSKDGLFYCRFDEKSRLTASSAGMAVFSKLLGNDEEAGKQQKVDVKGNYIQRFHGDTCQTAGKGP